MFLVHCPACGQRELRSTRALSSFSSTARGIEIAMACSRCGVTVHTLTGVRATAPAPVPSAVTAAVPAPAGAGVAA